ncbi:lysophospholipid acyltransferase family protein [Flavobacterium silvaticum]|uniref:Lipid A biosynthesis acyltransferase n=1 Tax=Flavobacterium silvaticum TaxID=1852020 RepID=A0A972JH05_9FLAO|nr:lysophospholipid acyltransferase family protein [Flavobacterium silvaticum]NMH28736.1 hypothetical protein [Flavobacterium silvaticum]
MIRILLYPLSLIPLPVLYFFSDACAFFLYSVIGYRRKVVKANIDKSFPDLDEAQRHDIEKKFYHNFCDHFFETLKLLSMSEETLHKHISADYTELKKAIDENQSIHVYLGHQFNWEWANAHIASTMKDLNVVVAYKPLRSEIFNDLMFKLRSRFGSKMVSSRNLKKEMEAFADEKHMLVLVADQNPKVPNRSFWTSFLSQPTAFMSGTELYTASHKTPMLFAEIIREARGYYKFVLTPVFDFKAEYKTGIITTLFTEKLESTIKSHPENYLWSHRRWKHLYSNEYQRRFLKREALLS